MAWFLVLNTNILYIFQAEVVNGLMNAQHSTVANLGILRFLGDIRVEGGGGGGRAIEAKQMVTSRRKKNTNKQNKGKLLGSLCS